MSRLADWAADNLFAFVLICLGLSLVFLVGLSRTYGAIECRTTAATYPEYRFQTDWLGGCYVEFAPGAWTYVPNNFAQLMKLHKEP